MQQYQQPITLFREVINSSRVAGTSGVGVVTVATLGPRGTSSQAAACHFVRMLEQKFDVSGEVMLYLSFEAAVDSVLAGEAGAVVIANAYANISQMYMNPQLRLASAFMLPTPSYGIAAAGTPIPLVVRIATHPAPLPLVAELLPPAFLLSETIFTSSTSEAARKVVVGEAELALTNEPSAHHYRLNFISRTRPIEMLWSVFILDDEAHH